MPPDAEREISRHGRLGRTKDSGQNVRAGSVLRRSFASMRQFVCLPCFVESPSGETEIHHFIDNTSANRATGSGVASGDSGHVPKIVTASMIEGSEVLNSLGERLGSIEETLIDMSRGGVAYVVLSSRGGLGSGDKFFAIPWSALTFDIDRRCFILDVAVERLKDAPGFGKNHWPLTTDPVWMREIHAYYG